MCCIHETEPLDAFAVAARRLYYSHSIRIVLQSSSLLSPRSQNPLFSSSLPPHLCASNYHICYEPVWTAGEQEQGEVD